MDRQPLAMMAPPLTPIASGLRKRERNRAMAYGLSTRALVADEHPSNGLGPRPATWRSLDADRRLQLIERVLNPANDRIDAYPLAL